MFNKKNRVGLLVKLIVIGNCFLCSIQQSQAVESTNCSRIISLAPSVTETLFALQLGPQVVGVTRFCKFPEETAKLAKVGGFIDPNYEAMVSLRPTIVVLLVEQREIAGRLRALKIPVLIVNHMNVSGILDSFTKIGESCLKVAEAESVKKDLQSQLQSIKESVKNKPPVRTLIAVGRTNADSHDGMFASGNDGFFNDILTLAGGININQNTTMNFPALSSEGILSANPEVIIEIMSGAEVMPGSLDKIRQSWKKFSEVSAVKNNRIYVFDEDFMTLPGPRLIKVVEKFVHALHDKNNEGT